MKSRGVDSNAKEAVITCTTDSLCSAWRTPCWARKMQEALRARQKRGEYDAIEDAETFATQLTDDLQQVSHDKHLHVNFSPKALANGEPGRNPDLQGQMRTQMERNNCFFEKVERFPPNIGYVKFNAFADPDVCGPTAIAAMNFLANVDAIIFDLRANGGGDPKMVALISTYLFGEPTHLNDLYNRKEDTTTQYWTLPYVPGKRFTGKPVFVDFQAHILRC